MARRSEKVIGKDRKAILKVAKEDLKKGAGEERVKDFLPTFSKPVISRALKSLDKKDLINRLERSGTFNIPGEPPDEYASGEYTKFIELTCKGRDYVSRRKQALNANFDKMEKLTLSESKLARKNRAE